MKFIGVVISILISIEVIMLGLVMFMYVTYAIFDGRDMSGTWVNLTTVLFLVVFFAAAIFLARKVYRYTKSKSDLANFMIFMVLLIAVVATISMFQSGEYVVN